MHVRCTSHTWTQRIFHLIDWYILESVNLSSKPRKVMYASSYGTPVSTHITYTPKIITYLQALVDHRYTNLLKSNLHDKVDNMLDADSFETILCYDWAGRRWWAGWYWSIVALGLVVRGQIEDLSSAVGLYINSCDRWTAITILRILHISKEKLLRGLYTNLMSERKLATNFLHTDASFTSSNVEYNLFVLERWIIPRIWHRCMSWKTIALCSMTPHTRISVIISKDNRVLSIGINPGQPCKGHPPYFLPLDKMSYLHPFDSPAWKAKHRHFPCWEQWTQ